VADLVLPATSYLERDGTIVNLEGRPQRLRRAVIPPAPDEVAWIAKLAERFGVEIDPHARPSPPRSGELPRAPSRAPVTLPRPPRAQTAKGGPLKLVRYRPLFSGPAVERVDELQFQRPEPRSSSPPATPRRGTSRAARKVASLERHLGAHARARQPAAGQRRRPRAEEHVASSSKPWIEQAFEQR
jgi:hypothetical protein